MKVNKKNRSFLFVLSVSLLFFIIKGVRYALIDSYIPLLFIFFFSVGFSAWFFNRKKIFKIALGSWGVVLMLWSLMRLAIPILMEVAPGVTEAHIRAQFSVVEVLISLWFLGSGWFLWKQRGWWFQLNSITAEST